jgi:hypothetical protein
MKYIQPQGYSAEQRKSYSQLAMDCLCVSNKDGTEIRRKLKEGNLKQTKVNTHTHTHTHTHTFCDFYKPLYFFHTLFSYLIVFRQYSVSIPSIFH